MDLSWVRRLDGVESGSVWRSRVWVGRHWTRGEARQSSKSRVWEGVGAKGRSGETEHALELVQMLSLGGPRMGQL